MKKLKLSAQDTTFISLLMVAEIAINGAMEEMEQCIEHKKDLPTKAHFQAIKKKIEFMTDKVGEFGDDFMEGQKEDYIAHCVKKANELARWIDNKQGRK